MYDDGNQAACCNHGHRMLGLASQRATTVVTACWDQHLSMPQPLSPHAGTSSSVCCNQCLGVLGRHRGML